MAWYRLWGRTNGDLPADDNPGQKPMCLNSGSRFSRSTRCPPPYVSSSGQIKFPKDNTFLS